MCPQGRKVEREIARLASASHGVLTRGDLERLGLTAWQIRHRVRRGDLIAQYRGVYRVGHSAFSLDARYLAAVRACGDGAVLCGLSAAYLFSLIRGLPPEPHVLTLTERRVPGIRTRRVRTIDSRDVTVLRGIPIATVPRTLVDITPMLDEEELARVCHEAWTRYRVKPDQVEDSLRRNPRSPGAARLRRVIGGDVHVLLSKLEKRFLHLLCEARLPMPKTNKVASGRRVDCRWAEHRLTVELDSYRFHNTRHSWEQDRKRERQAYARGDDFRRYTWGDVFEDPRLMMRELHALLADQPAARR